MQAAHASQNTMLSAGPMMESTRPAVLTPYFSFLQAIAPRMIPMRPMITAKMPKPKRLSTTAMIPNTNAATPMNNFLL